MEDDPITLELDVKLVKNAAGQLLLFQYPTRSNVDTIETDFSEAKIKRNQQRIQLTSRLDANASNKNYDRSKGQLIAANTNKVVDNDTEAAYFESGLVDKLVLESTPSTIDTRRYAIGFVTNGSMVLTPLDGIVQLRPNFDHIDISDRKIRQADAQKAAAEAAESGASDDDTAAASQPQAVTVRMARVESDWARERRLASYDHMQKAISAEKWTSCAYYNESSQESKAEIAGLERAGTRSGGMSYDALQKLDVEPADYLKQLLATEKGSKAASAPVDKQLAAGKGRLSLTQLKGLPLDVQVVALLKSAQVMTFSQLITLLQPLQQSEADVLTLLQKNAMLIQGCWVVKSDVLYDETAASPCSGAPASVLRPARDYVMWKFTHNRFVIRTDIASVIKLPADDVKGILEGISRSRASRGWQFLLDFDHNFMSSGHGNIVAEQQAVWEKKFLELCDKLTLKESDKKIKLHEHFAVPRRRRLSSTTSSPRRRHRSSTSVSRSADDSDGPPGDVTRKRRTSGQSKTRRKIAMETN